MMRMFAADPSRAKAPSPARGPARSAAAPSSAGVTPWVSPSHAAEQALRKARMRAMNPLAGNERSLPGDAAEQSVREAQMFARHPLAGHMPQIRPSAEPTVQAKPKDGATARELPSAAETASKLGGGEPLPAALASQLGSTFGHDLSSVRIHRDSSLASSLDARAFTAGDHIAFSPGNYAPGTRSGAALLAHEVTHVVQQSKGADGAVQLFHGDSSALEAEADAAAALATSGKRVPSVSPAGPGIQRQDREKNILPDAGDSKDVPADIPPGSVLGSIPVTLVAIEEDAAIPVGQPTTPAIPGFPLSTLGLGLNILAAGDLSWLTPRAGASRVLSSSYWNPLIPSSRGTMVLDRLVNSLPRDLTPRLLGELRLQQSLPVELSWVKDFGFVQDDLSRMPELITRWNQGTATAEEIALLRRAAEVHMGGGVQGSPLVSYTKPDTRLTSVGTKRFRVRIEIPEGMVLDVSGPNAFNEMGAIEGLNIVGESEMIVAAEGGRILSVQKGATSESSFLLRNARAFRWGGRILLVAGFGVSAYRVANARPKDRARVLGEEGGGQLGGFVGTGLATAGCVYFGIATGGIGLLLCGLVGGIAGGLAGSAAGGAAGDALANVKMTGSSPCPSCHAMQRAWASQSHLDEMKRRFGPSPSEILTNDDIARLRQWVAHEKTRRPLPFDSSNLPRLSSASDTEEPCPSCHGYRTPGPKRGTSDRLGSSDLIAFGAWLDALPPR